MTTIASLHIRETLIGKNRSIMKSKVNGRAGNTLGWITTIAMSIAAVAFLLTLGAGQ